jgi:hypothetical protein
LLERLELGREAICEVVKGGAAMSTAPSNYPAQFSVDYPDRDLNWVTTVIAADPAEGHASTLP